MVSIKDSFTPSFSRAWRLSRLLSCHAALCTASAVSLPDRQCPASSFPAPSALTLTGQLQPFRLLEPLLLFHWVCQLIFPNKGGRLPERNSHASCRRIFSLPRYTGGVSGSSYQGGDEARKGELWLGLTSAFPSMRMGATQVKLWEQELWYVRPLTGSKGSSLDSNQRASCFRCFSCLGVQGMAAPRVHSCTARGSGIPQMPAHFQPLHCWCFVLFCFCYCAGIFQLLGQDFVLCLKLSIIHRAAENFWCGISSITVE